MENKHAEKKKFCINFLQSLVKNGEVKVLDEAL
jgi:hypothetical protein